MHIEVERVLMNISNERNIKKTKKTTQNKKSKFN
jgi:hypothetical protein